MLVLGAVVIALGAGHAGALQNPQSGSVGLEGTISAPPPSKAAVITSPVSGRTYTTLPIDINGLCPEGVMVKLFSNNIFIGSVACTNGSYSLQADIFSGQNDLVARVYDNLDQAGPDSNTVTVNFNDPALNAFDSRVSLTSAYAKKGATPGQNLDWPIILSGGTGPYAISVDWGDGKPATLKSVPFAGTITINHVYDSAGIYRVIVKASDVKGMTAYLQLIGVGNGSVGASGTQTKDASGSSNTITITKTKFSILPAIIAIPLILITFWLGRRHELLVLRRRLEAATEQE